MIDVREPERAKEIVDRAVDLLRPMEYGGLAPHAPYTASANLYRYAEEAARQQNFLLTTHLAESSEEMQMFFNRDGPLKKFLTDIGRDSRTWMESLRRSNFRGFALSTSVGCSFI